MTVQEFNQRGATLDAQILGTDVSPQMVAQAQLARFNAAAIARGLSAERRERYFTRVENHQWEARPEIRRRASFRVHNLLESYAPLGRFDVIFCRNVLIYFSVASRRDILSRMAQALNPGGFLVLGASESLVRQGEEFELLRLPQGVLYRLRDKARAQR
jgi:chemotaxis protein methyltransferase CheR